MDNINKMKNTARKMALHIEEYKEIGCISTATFYQSRLDKLEREILECERSLIKSRETRGLPLPKSTF